MLRSGDRALVTGQSGWINRYDRLYPERGVCLCRRLPPLLHEGPKYRVVQIIDVCWTLPEQPS